MKERCQKCGAKKRPFSYEWMCGSWEDDYSQITQSPACRISELEHENALLHASMRIALAYCDAIRANGCACAVGWKPETKRTAAARDRAWLAFQPAMLAYANRLKVQAQVRAMTKAGAQ